MINPFIFKGNWPTFLNELDSTGPIDITGSVTVPPSTSQYGIIPINYGDYSGFAFQPCLQAKWSSPAPTSGSISITIKGLYGNKAIEEVVTTPINSSLLPNGGTYYSFNSFYVYESIQSIEYSVIPSNSSLEFKVSIANNVLGDEGLHGFLGLFIPSKENVSYAVGSITMGSNGNTPNSVIGYELIGTSSESGVSLHPSYWGTDPSKYHNPMSLLPFTSISGETLLSTNDSFSSLSPFSAVTLRVKLLSHIFPSNKSSLYWSALSI